MLLEPVPRANSGVAFPLPPRCRRLFLPVGAPAAMLDLGPFCRVSSVGAAHMSSHRPPTEAPPCPPRRCLAVRAPTLPAAVVGALLPVTLEGAASSGRAHRLLAGPSVVAGSAAPVGLAVVVAGTRGFRSGLRRGRVVDAADAATGVTMAALGASPSCSSSAEGTAEAAAESALSLSSGGPRRVVPRVVQVSAEKPSEGDSLLSVWTLPTGGDASGSVVAKLLQAVFRHMLASSADVTAQVSSRIGRLARGSVLGVLLFGRALRTPLGFTGREMQMFVPEECRIDRKALFRGKLALQSPTRGMVEIIFNEEDFGNFLMYPQIAASAPLGLTFRRRVHLNEDGVRFEVQAQCSGGAKDEFSALLSWPSSSHCSSRRLAAGERRGLGPCVRVLRSSGGGHGSADDVAALERSLTDFFRELTLDLAGLALNITAMDVLPTPTLSVDSGIGVATAERGAAQRFLLRLSMEGEIRRVPDPLHEKI
mmetsp:Transcript_170652/g.547383  ORF Transcript_170652/g.547383 Transcript_170652/m.547383 type:complete len:480 (-) Transcript_170652:65-1504(-)